MPSIWKSLIVFLIAYLILTVPSNVSSINQSFIGVEEGDTFTYVVDKYSATEEFVQGYYLGFDDATQQQIYATKGEKFIITIGELKREGAKSFRH